MEKVSLEEILGGALQEQFGKAFDRVIENLSDPNTSFKEARKITITLKFTQNEIRDDVSCAVSVVEKLAAQAPMQTNFAVGKNLRTGELYAEEYGRNKPMKGQVTVDEIDGMAVDTETGEVLDGNPGVVDLRMAMSN